MLVEGIECMMTFFSIGNAFLPGLTFITFIHYLSQVNMVIGSCIPDVTTKTLIGHNLWSVECLKF